VDVAIEDVGGWTIGVGTSKRAREQEKGVGPLFDFLLSCFGPLQHCDSSTKPAPTRTIADDRHKDHPIDHFADRVRRLCRDRGAPVCVGIDPVYERLPDDLRPGGPRVAADDRVEAIGKFCTAVMETVAPHVVCVKIQSACFERYLWPGVELFHRLVAHARELGVLVIADAKRGDIGVSAEHYAAGCLGPVPYEDLGKLLGPDALTVNSYLGSDSLDPFLAVAAANGRGLFALVRTSNPGSDTVQSLPLSDGRTVSDAVAQMIDEVGDDASLLGHCGDSLLGAVVGATKAADAARLRQLMPRQIFLVPGFGAQGGRAQDVAACFRPDGTGALITASRSVLYAYENRDGLDWQKAIEQAAIEMKTQIIRVMQEM